MFKKILCLVLAIMTIASLAVIGVSAADETVAATGAESKIYFEVPGGWNNYKKIFCHIWPYGGEPLANWQSKKESCTDEGNGKWSYDLSKVGGISGGTYCVIFSADTGVQTYDTIMTAACIGDTMYCTSEQFENPADSNKKCVAGYWKNQNKSTAGPVMLITSIGTVQGTVVAPGESASGLFKTFLTKNLGNARQYSGKSDQELCDGIAKELGLGQDTIEKLIKESGIQVEWEKAKSSAQTGGGVGNIGGGSGSGSGSSANGNSVTTGQEMTVVYIAIAMMLASAAVVFFARKKRVTE